MYINFIEKMKKNLLIFITWAYRLVYFHAATMILDFNLHVSSHVFHFTPSLRAYVNGCVSSEEKYKPLYVLNFTKDVHIK